MSKITYFASRQKVLEVLAAAAPIVWTAVPLGTFVPAGCTGLLCKVEIEQQVLGGAPLWAMFQVRKDVAQGIASEVYMDGAWVNGTIQSDNALIPVDAVPQIEYTLIGAPAGTGTVNLRIYALGYLT